MEWQKSIKKIINTEDRKIIVDFYISHINTIIEYNGRQHYEPIKWFYISKKEALDNFIKQQNRDAYLQSFCDQHNIRLIWIDGREYINSKLKNILLK